MMAPSSTCLLTWRDLGGPRYLVCLTPGAALRVIDLLQRASNMKPQDFYLRTGRFTEEIFD